MEIARLSTIASLTQSDQARSADTFSNNNNFLNSLVDLAVAQKQPPSQTQAVYAGQGKEFEFMLKEEKLPDKGFKYRTLDDAMAEIEKIVEQLKRDSK
ncbi:hypothetical protein A2311_01550 [candidate division WOR-1 bacterium RIFOXYB2_FULL_48_7]|uniref:Uncharacterized protein n=1 Tax=candidate division WOR-1 bacterium RIFOXYB2_FULL_48_7 TaxID=1802583 RepID=A0A1F4TRG9_UNCSA|nr:MAG: hypothetical protein A2311_01550 [candidate division WOR-1 bacterium RIFOXYB2_FULL_48_7]